MPLIWPSLFTERGGGAGGGGGLARCKSKRWQGPPISESWGRLRLGPKTRWIRGGLACPFSLFLFSMANVSEPPPLA